MCKSGDALDSVLRNTYINPENNKEIADALEDLLSRSSPSTREELAYAILKRAPFDDYFRRRISLSTLGIQEADTTKMVDYTQLLRSVLIPVNEETLESKWTERLSRIQTNCAEILARLFDDHDKHDHKTVVMEIANLLDDVSDADSKIVLVLSIVSLLNSYGMYILEWFANEKMIDAFSRFLSENLVEFYCLNTLLSHDFKEREKLGLFFDSIRMDSRIINGITSFITNHEINSEDLYMVLRNLTTSQSLVKEQEIGNALLAHKDALIEMIKSEDELFHRRSEIWSWDVIRLIDMFSALKRNKDIKRAISEQIKFIAGCMIFGPPEDYPIIWLLDVVIDSPSLLSFSDIQVALCFCFRFRTDSESTIGSSAVSRLASNYSVLGNPLIREALQRVIENWNYDIQLPSKRSKEYSTSETKKITKNIRQASYPLAAVMVAYFDEKAWRDDSVRTSAKSRLNDIAFELESNQYDNYEWWNYYNNPESAWHFCQVDILFEHSEIVTALRKEKWELLSVLSEFYDELPNASLEKACSALGVFWNQYIHCFEEKTKEEEADDLESFMLKQQQLKSKVDERAKEDLEKFKAGERVSLNESLLAYSTGMDIDRDDISFKNVTLYDLVMLWIHPKHPWAPREFLEIIEHFKGPFDKDDPIWNFAASFPTGVHHNWSLQRTTQISVDEQIKDLTHLISKYEYDLKEVHLTKDTMRYYIQSRRLTAEDDDDDDSSNNSYKSYEPK